MLGSPSLFVEWNVIHSLEESNKKRSEEWRTGTSGTSTKSLNFTKSQNGFINSRSTHCYHMIGVIADELQIRQVYPGSNGDISSRFWCMHAGLSKGPFCSFGSRLPWRMDTSSRMECNELQIQHP
jgi:hypothetical protein